MRSERLCYPRVARRRTRGTALAQRPDISGRDARVPSGCVASPRTDDSAALTLTGERTLPGIRHENYWFQRHLAAYRWVAKSVPVRGAVVVEAGCGEGYGGQLLADAGAALVAGSTSTGRPCDTSPRPYPGVAAGAGQPRRAPARGRLRRPGRQRSGRRAPVGPRRVRPRVRPGPATRRPAGRHHAQPADVPARQPVPQPRARRRRARRTRSARTWMSTRCSGCGTVHG